MDKQNIREIIGKCEDEAPVLGMVIKDIFMTCDTENEGLVPVSKLIDFIMPFLQGNVHALDELQKSLDPNNLNPSIDIDTFHKDMNEWTLKISSAEHEDEEDLHNITPRDFERLDKDMSFGQSTPVSKSSFGHHLLKGYVESGISNLSIASSVIENNSVYFPERTLLEEQIQQLQHQNRQVTEELGRVKAELTAVTEHSETLQADLDKVLKRLANEQKLNAQLQSERTQEENSEEELCCARKQMVKLERSVAALEKQNVQLQQELDAVVTEKQGLECQIQRMDRKFEETKKSMVMLQTEIDVRKSDVVAEQHAKEALAQHNQDLCDIIEKYIIYIDRLKLEKTVLRKLFRNKLNKGESLRGIEFLAGGGRQGRSNSFSEYAASSMSRKTAVDKRRVSDFTAKYVPETRTSPRAFNSPKLLRMLSNPVTPNIDGAQKPTPQKFRRFGGETNFASMLLRRSCNGTMTPYLNNEQRSLLDTTPPAELSKIPILCPRLAPSNEPYAVATEMVDHIFERAMRVHEIRRNEANQFESPPGDVDSPPVMYVVERTPQERTCHESVSPTAPPYSPKLNDSSDDYFFYNYAMMTATNETSNENLLDEMAKATVCSIDEESECEESVTETNGDKIENGNARHSPNAKTCINEVHLKLAEYIDLEQKCEVLEQKIEELEMENSQKAMKIVDLTNQIEKLRQQLSAGCDTNRVEELLKVVDGLERENSEHQTEKKNLIEKIRRLNEEKAVLQLSKEEVLRNMVEDTEMEKCDARQPPEDLECLKSDYERVKSSMETYQRLNDNLAAKNQILCKSVVEKGKHLDDSLEEVVQLREQSESLKGETHRLGVQLEDSRRVIANFEMEVSRLKADLEKVRERLEESEKLSAEQTLPISSDSSSTTLIDHQAETDALKESVEQLKEELRQKCDELERIEQSNTDLQQNLEETRRQLTQETSKQDYLYKKFIDLENELIAEKTSGERLKETLSDLERRLTETEAHNRNLASTNANLTKLYEEKTKEAASLLETKSFIAGRNEELLQENAEICLKFGVVSDELNAKSALLDGMKRKLCEIEQLRADNRRIRAESEDILVKMRALDSEEGATESDQMDSGGDGVAPERRGRDRRTPTGRKTTNFDRLMMRIGRLEERNVVLAEEVAKLHDRLAKETEAKNAVMARANTVKDILYERRIRLGRATESTVNVWKQTLEKYVSGPLFDEDLEPESSSSTFTGPLDDEMWQLKHQIHHTTVLLSHLACFMNRQTPKKNECTQTDHVHCLFLPKVCDASVTKMVAYTVDKDHLLQRFHRTKSQLGDAERLLAETVSLLALYLEENTPHLNVSHYMSAIVQLCGQVSISAVQYGSLRQQTELAAAAEMMMSYVANLKQEIDSLTPVTPAVPEPTTPLDRIDYQLVVQPEDKSSMEVKGVPNRLRRLLSCAKLTCVIFILSIFVLVASLVLNTDIVFKMRSNPPPT